jgi:molybdopterin molybdotransferase
VARFLLAGVKSESDEPRSVHNRFVLPLTFTKAREVVIQSVRAARRFPGIETADLLGAAGRVLAEDIAADRETPPTPRSVRDGFAIRAAEAPGEFEIIGEVRAGSRFEGTVEWRQAVEIMTGAPIPDGADAVAMVEHAERAGNRLTLDQPVDPQQFINPKGCEASANEVVLRAGKRLDYSDIAMLAAFGRRRVQVYRKLTVAIVATGDEIVDVESTPSDYQIRNSNAYSLAAQVLRAGGKPSLLPAARDTADETREMIERGLAADLLLLSGGVSAGKYDVVEGVLAGLNAEFYFDRVLIQPGQPVVFGRARDKFFFGLPGNPSSTMVTFEIFGRAALELLSGQDEAPLNMPYAKLTREFKHRAGVTRFLPARLSEDGASVTPVAWHGSGDIPAMTRANAYLVADPDCPVYEAGAWIRVLAK